MREVFLGTQINRQEDDQSYDSFTRMTVQIHSLILMFAIW